MAGLVSTVYHFKIELTVRSFLDPFQTLPYNSLIFGTLVQSDGNYTAPGWVNRAEQAKSRRTVNFQKFCEFKLLPNVENRRKNERTVSFRSANSTVTCLRSPSRALREVRIFSARWAGMEV